MKYVDPIAYGTFSLLILILSWTTFNLKVDKSWNSSRRWI